MLESQRKIQALLVPQRGGCRRVRRRATSERPGPRQRKARAAAAAAAVAAAAAAWRLGLQVSQGQYAAGWTARASAGEGWGIRVGLCPLPWHFTMRRRRLRAAAAAAPRRWREGMAFPRERYEAGPAYDGSKRRRRLRNQGRRLCSLPWHFISARPADPPHRPQQPAVKFTQPWLCIRPAQPPVVPPALLAPSGLAPAAVGPLADLRLRWAAPRLLPQPHP